MNFFPYSETIPDDTIKGVSVELLHRMQCSACSLNTPVAKHLEPHGAENPLVYILGEAPGEEEEKQGIPFIGRAGQVLRWRIPDSWNLKLRWNNCVRTRPTDKYGENRDPSIEEMTCCWPSVAGDISSSKPLAIFGMGNIPLWWALKESGITKWRGRKVPVMIQDHACWFFPMFHPSYVARVRKFEPRKLSEYGSEDEFAFAKDLERAFEFLFLEDVKSPEVHTESMARDNIFTVTGFGHDDLCRVTTFLKECYQKSSVGIDFETATDEHSPRPYAEGARILSVALSHVGGTLAFPLDHPKAGWRKKERIELDRAFKDFLYQAPTKKISHNLAFELEWAGHFYGKDCLRAQPWEDTLSMAYVLDQRKGTLSLEFQCLENFGINIKNLSNIDTRKGLLDVPLEKLLLYNGIDAKYHRLLFLELRKRLKAAGTWKVYLNQLERVPTVVLTQMKGIPVDQAKVKEFYDELTKAEALVRERIEHSKEAAEFRRLKQEHFNPSSVPNVKFVLQKIMGYQDITSTVDTVLSKYKKPFVKLISDWRSVTKMSSTYVLPFMNQEGLTSHGKDPKVSCIFPDGLIHHALRTTSTDTWRTSSDSPNIQNQPHHDEAHIGDRNIQLKEFRTQIRPRKASQRIVSFDFGQIQARNVAMESQDQNLVKALWDRYDIHGDWAERMIKKYPEWIKEGVKAYTNDKTIRSHYRQRSKNEFVFASFFGAQAFSSAQRLGIPENLVQDLLEEFFDEFPGVLTWQRKIKKLYRKDGYVTGLSGFRRHAPVTENQLINAPIQADESVIVLDAMTRLSKLDHDKLQANMEIHDSLDFFWEKSEIDKLSEIVIEEMLRVTYPWVNVPIVVERSIGEDWCNMIGAGVYASDTWKK